MGLAFLLVAAYLWNQKKRFDFDVRLQSLVILVRNYSRGSFSLGSGSWRGNPCCRLQLTDQRSAIYLQAKRQNPNAIWLESQSLNEQTKKIKQALKRKTKHLFTQTKPPYLVLNSVQCYQLLYRVSLKKKCFIKFIWFFFMEYQLQNVLLYFMWRMINLKCIISVQWN